MDGFPLGLELAGILIHEGIVSLEAFPTKFENKYEQLTQFSVDPGMWFWSKNNTVFGIFQELYETLLANNESSALLLTLCSIYGPCEIPTSLLRDLEWYSADVDSDAHKDWRRLKELVCDDVRLNMAIYELHRVALAKRKQDPAGNVTSISLHGSICQWRLATIGDSKAEWIIRASYNLARHIHTYYDQ